MWGSTPAAAHGAAADACASHLLLHSTACSCARDTEASPGPGPHAESPDIAWQLRLIPLEPSGAGSRGRAACAGGQSPEDAAPQDAQVHAALGAAQSMRMLVPYLDRV